MQAATRKERNLSTCSNRLGVLAAAHRNMIARSKQVCESLAPVCSSHGARQKDPEASPTEAVVWLCHLCAVIMALGPGRRTPKPRHQKQIGA
eukprot:scaffold128116_cov35-Tisochrysis_lutea.AAC.3